MKHPNEAALALHAGGDLGVLARWRVERHLAKCERCREEIAAFNSVREIVTELGEIPEIPWNRLAAEMKANIRLGVAAGECVRPAETPLREMPFFTRARVAVAMASIVALLVTGMMLERPRPAVAADQLVLERTANGIQIGQGATAFRLMNAARAKDVTFSVNAQGAMGARYVDPDSGYVTINHVYAE
jgi:anti-sigma factor RsiW